MIFEYESIPGFLEAELRRRIQTNPNYSLRAFAQSLKLSPGALSDILKGHRGLGLKVTPRVAQALGLNKTEAKHLVFLAQKGKLNGVQSAIENSKLAPKEERLLSEEVFALVSEWYHFAILNLIDCKGFQWKATWIATRLGISRAQAKMAMDLLLRLNIVTRKNMKYLANDSHITSETDIPSHAIRKYHRQILEKAIYSLDSQELGERDISGVGFAFDTSKIQDLKKDIADFQDKILAKYSHGKKTEVYFLETALFKLSRGEIN
jgi:uncharacterized protein (TIGR02147 family)